MSPVLGPWGPHSTHEPLRVGRGAQHWEWCSPQPTGNLSWQWEGSADPKGPCTDRRLSTPWSCQHTPLRRELSPLPLPTFHPGFIGRDGGTLDSHAVLLGGQR